MSEHLIKITKSRIMVVKGLLVKYREELQELLPQKVKLEIFIEDLKSELKELEAFLKKPPNETL